MEIKKYIALVEKYKSYSDDDTVYEKYIYVLPEDTPVADQWKSIPDNVGQGSFWKRSPTIDWVWVYGMAIPDGILILGPVENCVPLKIV